MSQYKGSGFSPQYWIGGGIVKDSLLDTAVNRSSLFSYKLKLRSLLLFSTVSVSLGAEGEGTNDAPV